MNIANLMSGIAVVIDDAFGENSSAKSADKIIRLVKDIETEWKLPFYKTHEIPSDETICKNLLKSASFILLDWRLWPKGASHLEEEGIRANRNFLGQAKDYFVPVFIFTNEDPADVKAAILPDGLYDNQHPGNNFIFIGRKQSLTRSRLFASVQKWVDGNASVYTLKAWEQAFNEAKKNVFGSMYKKSPSWPRVFWASYKKDGADPSFSMVSLINNNLFARMETDIFEQSVLGKRQYGTGGEDIKSVLEGASFIPQKKLPANEIRSGDLFKLPGGKYLINIRPDCDCIPRNNSQEIDNVELYCIEGQKMSERAVWKSYKEGHFDEKIWESISFSLHAGKSVRFNFQNFDKRTFSDIKDKRVGRLIHPYITRIQQRYALYLQRQGLPRIPEEAIKAASKPK